MARPLVPRPRCPQGWRPPEGRALPPVEVEVSSPARRVGAVHRQTQVSVWPGRGALTGARLSARARRGRRCYFLPFSPPSRCARSLPAPVLSSFVEALLDISLLALAPGFFPGGIVAPPPRTSGPRRCLAES